MPKYAYDWFSIGESDRLFFKYTYYILFGIMPEVKAYAFSEKF